ncbi:MAG: FlgD immunoglobulin-like domain containing protein, partial [Candidatus Poribacteria bacterium]
LGAVGPSVTRVLGSPRLELLVETAAYLVLQPEVQVVAYLSNGEPGPTGEPLEYEAQGTLITTTIPIEFMFDGYPPQGWLEGILGDPSAVPGISAVVLYYAEASSAYDDPATLSFNSVSLDPLGSMIWIGSADITPGAQVIYYYDVVLDTPVTTPEGSPLFGLRLPDPRNLQWVDRGALDRLAAAGVGFGDVGDVSFFDPSSPDVGRAFASIAARELLGTGDLGLASTFSAPIGRHGGDQTAGDLWHLSFTNGLLGDSNDKDWELEIVVTDGLSEVDRTEPVFIQTRYDPDATMNLATAAMTLLENELFTVDVVLKVGGSVVGSDGLPIPDADPVVWITTGPDNDAGVYVTPDEDGLFEVSLSEGSYEASAAAAGFGEETIEFNLVVGEEPPTLDFVLGSDVEFSPATHEVVEGETDLQATVGEVTGGVEPYEFSVAGGSAAFWLDVDAATGDLIFAGGVTEVPGPGPYQLNVDVSDSADGFVSGTIVVDVIDAPSPTLEMNFDSHAFTEGSPSVDGSFGGATGGVEPYGFEVTGGTAESWLEVDAVSGELFLDDSVSYVPAPGMYTLEVRVTDSAAFPDQEPGVVDGVVDIMVSALSIEWVQLSTGGSKVLQSDLDVGDVTVILNVIGDAASLATVSLYGGNHSIHQTPYPAGDAAFIYLTFTDTATIDPVYGRYAIAFTPNGGTERTTSEYVNIVQTPEQGWQGLLWLSDGGVESAYADIGAGAHSSTSYDPIEDIVAPPSPDEEDKLSITLWRDGLALSRDILAMVEGEPLEYTFDVSVPGSEAVLEWTFDEAEHYYDAAVLDHVDSEESYDLNEVGYVTLPEGDHSFVLTLERSPYQKLPLALTPSWTLISFPGPAVEGAPDALADAFDVDAVYGWDPAFGYDGPLTGSEPLAHITRGYFVHRDSAFDSVSADINVDLDDPTAVEASIPVDTGWNIVGVVDGGLDVGSISATANTVFEWDASSQEYSSPRGSGDLLFPTQAVWVFNPGDPYIASVTQLRFRAGSAAEPAPATESPPRPDWTASLQLTTADGQARSVQLGVGEFADASYDAMDIVTPPPPAARDYAEFYADVDHIAGRLSRSVQPLGRDGGEWTLTARLPGGGVIRWDGVELGVGYRLTLHAEGARYDMLTRGEATLPGGRHALRVTLSWLAPEQTRLLTNYPNPFNPETWIPFELSAASSVTVRVYDLNGQVVRRLDVGFREAGYYTGRADAAYWDGRNNAGERAASGVYFYELRAGAQQSLRRMVIHK